MSAETSPGPPTADRVDVIVAGSLDVDTLPELSAVLVEALDLRPAELVLDLTQCPHIDAAAIGLLLLVHTQTCLAGGSLTLHGPSVGLRRALRRTDADRVLHLTPAEDLWPDPYIGALPTASERITVAETQRRA